MLTNIIISSMLMFNSFDYLTDTNHYAKETKIEQKKELINPNILINYAISCELIRKDIFDYTKENYNKQIIETNISYYGSAISTNYLIKSYGKEKNSIADIFWKNNLWELGFIAACGFNYVITDIFNQIDKSQILSSMYLITISILELNAIKTWDIYGQNINIKIPIYTATF